MKILLMFLILILCFIIIYVMIYRREIFYYKVNIVNDITDLKQGRVYIIQEKDSFLLDFEIYYYDYIHNNSSNNNKQDYVMASEILLNQILQEYKETDDVVLPSKMEFYDKRIKISEYDEIWRKNDKRYY